MAAPSRSTDGAPVLRPGVSAAEWRLELALRGGVEA